MIDDYYLYVYIKFCQLHHEVVLLLRIRKDMMKHLRITPNMPRMGERESVCVCEKKKERKKERKTYARREKEKRNMYDTLVQFCQAFTCLSILSNMLSSDEVFLAFIHR
jgi:hypothetical protein